MALALETAPLPADAVEVGRVVGAWGIKGWFKIQPYSASPEALFSSKRWYLQTPLAVNGGPVRSFEAFGGTVLLPVLEAKEHTSAVVARAHEVPDRNAAESLKGARVFVPRSSFPSTAPDEYYWVDLLGLTVHNREGQLLGTVKDLLSTGAQTVLVLAYEHDGKAQERMIPFVATYIDSVDLAARKIHVDWGLDY